MLRHRRFRIIFLGEKENCPAAYLHKLRINSTRVRDGIFRTHGESFSKSYKIKPKSNCICHAPIYLEQKTDTVRLLFQINRCMANTI